MSTIKVYTCPKCGSHDIRVGVLVYIDATDLLNDEEIDGSDLVDQAVENFNNVDFNDWACGACGAQADEIGVNVEVSAVTEIEDTLDEAQS